MSKKEDYVQTEMWEVPSSVSVDSVRLDLAREYLAGASEESFNQWLRRRGMDPVVAMKNR